MPHRVVGERHAGALVVGSASCRAGSGARAWSRPSTSKGASLGATRSSPGEVPARRRSTGGVRWGGEAGAHAPCRGRGAGLGGGDREPLRLQGALAGGPRELPFAPGATERLRVKLTRYRGRV